MEWRYEKWMWMRKYSNVNATTFCWLLCLSCCVGYRGSCTNEQKMRTTHSEQQHSNVNAATSCWLLCLSCCVNYRCAGVRADAREDPTMVLEKTGINWNVRKVRGLWCRGRMTTVSGMRADARETPTMMFKRVTSTHSTENMSQLTWTPNKRNVPTCLDTQ